MEIGHNLVPAPPHKMSANMLAMYIKGPRKICEGETSFTHKDKSMAMEF